MNSGGEILRRRERETLTTMTRISCLENDRFYTAVKVKVKKSADV